MSGRGCAKGVTGGLIGARGTIGGEHSWPSARFADASATPPPSRPSFIQSRRFDICLFFSSEGPRRGQRRVRIDLLELLSSSETRNVMGGYLAASRRGCLNGFGI